MHNALQPVAAEIPGDGVSSGRLELGFERAPSGQTFLDRQYASYPFHVCRPFYLDDAIPGMATVYTQSCSGGLYTQDRLISTINAGCDTQVHLTTQAATIVHKSTRGPARQQMLITAGAGAYVEYLPDPVILLPGAHLETKLRVRMADMASVVLFDAFLTHDPDGVGRTFERMVSEVVIEDPGGPPMAIDRFNAIGSDFADPCLGATGGFGCQGTIIAYSPQNDPDELLEAVRRTGCGDAAAGSSMLPGRRGVWMRIMAADGAGLKSAMVDLWSAVREVLTGAPPDIRRK